MKMNLAPIERAFIHLCWVQKLFWSHIKHRYHSDSSDVGWNLHYFISSPSSGDLVDLCAMPLSVQDRHTIETVWKKKGWSARNICSEFPGRNWSVTTVHDLIQKGWRRRDLQTIAINAPKTTDSNTSTRITVLSYLCLISDQNNFCTQQRWINAFSIGAKIIFIGSIFFE